MLHPFLNHSRGTLHLTFTTTVFECQSLNYLKYLPLCCSPCFYKILYSHLIHNKTEISTLFPLRFLLPCCTCCSLLVSQQGTHSIAVWFFRSVGKESKSITVLTCCVGIIVLYTYQVVLYIDRSLLLLRPYHCTWLLRSSEQSLLIVPHTLKSDSIRFG